MKKYRISISLLACFVLGLAGFIVTKQLPFGWVFNASIILSIVGLVGFLGYVAYVWWFQSLLKKALGGILAIFAFVIVSVVSVAFLDIRILIPGISSQVLTKEQWLADFEFLDDLLQQHPAYSDSLAGIIRSYQNQMEASREVSDQIALITFMKMVSSFQDGHSNVLPFQLRRKTRYLPIQVYEFEDGVYITHASRPELIGWKIMSVNDMKIEDVLKKITPLIGSDNSFYTQYQRALYVPNTDVLQALGISSSQSEVNLGIEKDGEQKKEHLKSLYMIRWLFWSLAPTDEVRPVGHQIRTKPNQVEIKNDTLLWMTFNNTGPEVLLAGIANKIQSNAYGSSINHLVLDMRNNTGGDNSSYNEFINVLEASDLTLTLLTSRKTFSAGINFISELILKRDVTIIGEPTGAGHNHYGDARYLFLPNSGIMLTLSTKKWVFIPESPGNSIIPDVRVSYRSFQYFNRVDPWVAALENQQE